MDIARQGDTAPTPGRHGLSVEALLERLYRRTRARYLDTLLAIETVAALLFVVPGYTALLIPIWDLSVEDYLRFVLAFELPVALVGFPLAFVIFRRLMPDTYRWLSGRRGRREAPPAWRSTVAGLPRAVAGALFWVWLCTVPPAIYVGQDLHFAWYGYPLYLVILLGLIAVAGVFVYLLFEQGLRPLVREVSGYLPEQFELPGGTVSLAAKALVLIPAINFFTAGVVAALARNSSLAPEAYMALIGGLGLIVSLTVSLVLTLMFRSSILRRLGDLRGAMLEVDRGDFSTRLPPLAGDELDEIGATFNEMVVGLSERESLREQNAELVDHLRASQARIVTAADEERRRVERDLHDGAQQQLVLLGLKLSSAQRLSERDPAAALAVLEELQADSQRALSELRDLAHGIYPALLENEGLAAALGDAARRAAIPTTLECDGARRYPPELEAAVYFCCLEALQNAAKHAGEGARATVELAEHDRALEFAVADDGRGCDPAAAQTSAGLQNMTDRIGALGGSLRIESAPGQGTRVTGVVPLEEARP